MEVFEYLDDSGTTMVKRVPESGMCEITWGSQLTVRESQNAVFFRDGKAIDTFGPGRYVLKTQNIPKITKWVTRFGYGETSPFRSEVYFLSMKLFRNLKWGTKEPILFKDSELKMVRIRSFGAFSIQINDPEIFMNKVVGTQGFFKDSDIQDYLKTIILTRLTDALGNQYKSVFDLPSNFNKLSLLVKSSIELDFENLGLYIHDFYINSVSLPPEVQKMIDTKTGITAIGDMDQFMKYKTAMALEKAAENPGGTAAAGVNLGAGIGMGFLMPHMMQTMMQPAAQPVPQPAVSPAGPSVSKTNGNSGSISSFEKLKQLKELLDAGIITNEEFEQKKKEYLDAM